MIPPTQEDGEIKYRFSRPVRLWATAFGFVFFIGMSTTFVIMRAWDGVVGGLVGVFGVAGLLAQQLGIRTPLSSKLPQGPLARLLLSVAILALVMALVAVQSDETAPVVVVGGVLFALLVIQFWWEKRSRESKERANR